jgi:predicted hotdog family 3-hydroxylacyl-ACP dehydratase
MSDVTYVTITIPHAASLCLIEQIEEFQFPNTFTCMVIKSPKQVAIAANVKAKI